MFWFEFSCINPPFHGGWYLTFIYNAAGLLWSEQTREPRELEENMEAYFNTLQGFLLLSHGSTEGAGPTLSSYVHASVKRVIDSSFKLFKESVSSYGNLSLSLSLSLSPVELNLLRNIFFSAFCKRHSYDFGLRIGVQ